MAENKKEPKVGWERLQAALEEADKDPKKKRGPPIYEPESYPYHLLSALAYVIPVVDASDLGKYMFEVDTVHCIRRQRRHVPTYITNRSGKYVKVNYFVLLLVEPLMRSFQCIHT